MIDNPYQPGNRDAASPFPLVRIDGLGDRPFPTGKWYKGFFYRTPARLTANFSDAPPWDPAAGNNGQNDTAQESVFAFPNRLNLDDRVPLVSAAFPRPRYIAPGLDPNADVYKLLNRFKTDDVFYPVIASPLADLLLAASTGVDTEHDAQHRPAGRADGHDALAERRRQPADGPDRRGRARPTSPSGTTACGR